MCFFVKDPEGILGPPQTGHIARREFQRKLETDADAREAFQRQLVQEKERRRSLREVILRPLTWFLYLFEFVKLV